MEQNGSENTIVNLSSSLPAKPSCGCRSKRLDEPCILKSICNWNICKDILLCSACAFWNKDKSEHECMGYLIRGTPLSVENRLQFLNDSVYRVLLNPKNIDEIFYC